MSPKPAVTNSSFKLSNNAAAPNAPGVSRFEGLTPKQTAKVFQTLRKRKTENKLRESQLST